MTDDPLQAARYRAIVDLAKCDEKHGAGLVLGTGKLKAMASFRYWCEAAELDALLDGVRGPARAPRPGVGKTADAMSLHELQAEFSYWQAVLHRRVAGDPLKGVHSGPFGNI